MSGERHVGSRRVSRIIPLLLYLQAAWGTLVVPCVTNPTNWEQCFTKHDEWLIPELIRGYELWRGIETPYSREADILE